MPVLPQVKCDDTNVNDGETGQMQPDHIIALLFAADRFQLPELVEHCVILLGLSLTVENFAERLALADTVMAFAPKLMSYCTDFLR